MINRLRASTIMTNLKLPLWWHVKLWQTFFLSPSFPWWLMGLNWKIWNVHLLKTPFSPHLIFSSINDQFGKDLTSEIGLSAEHFTKWQLLRFSTPTTLPRSGQMMLTAPPPKSHPLEKESKQGTHSPKRHKQNFTEQCWDRDFFLNRKSKC